jgi:hypothetical protein
VYFLFIGDDQLTRYVFQVIDIEDKAPIKGVSICLEGSGSLLTDQEGYVTVDHFEPLLKLDLTHVDYFPMIHEIDRDSLTSPVQTLYITKRKPGRTQWTFGGDVMVGRRFYDKSEERPYIDLNECFYTEAELIRNLFNCYRPYLLLDAINSVNLESCILSDESMHTYVDKNYWYYSRPALLDALSMINVNHVNLANNHLYDYGKMGLDETLNHLRIRPKLKYSGAGLDLEQAMDSSVFHAEGLDYYINGFQGWSRSLPTDEYSETMAAEMHREGVLVFREQYVRKVLKNKPSFIHLHSGKEYSKEPNEKTQNRAKVLSYYGASVIIGHHTHTVQGMEKIGDTLYLHSLGNMIFDQDIPSTRPRVLVTVWMDNGKFAHGEVIPFYSNNYRTKIATGEQAAKVRNNLTLKPNNMTYVQSGEHLMFS